MTSTTLTAWLLLLWQTLQEKGFDPQEIFDAAGVETLSFGDSQSRFDSIIMPKLWDIAIDKTGDVDIGLATGQNWNATTFHALGFAWLASSSLLEALERLVRYARIVNSSLSFELVKAGATYRLNMILADDRYQIHPASFDATIASFIQMGKLLMGDHFSLLALEIMLPYREPGTLETFLGIMPKYNCAQNVVILDAKMVEKELVSGNSSLVLATEQVAREYLNWLDKEDVVSAVKAKIVELLPSGRINEKEVANRIKMDLRTMQRRLKDNKQSFKTILNDTRKEVVHNHIYNSQMSLTEIAYLLGFADQANFTRAFKRWTGSSPSEFRKAWSDKMRQSRSKT